MEKISVIMSAYNESVDIFEKAIFSILNQTYKNIQLVVIVDNPNNKEVINCLNNINDTRLEFYINEQNIGITKSLNRALEYCDGDYIARMDSDDISILDRFEIQLNYLKENSLDLCGSYVEWFSEEQESIRIVKYPSSEEKVKRQLYHRNCIAHPTFFAKKNIYDNLKKYNEISCCEDYEFLLRALAKKYKLGNVPKVLLKYRVNNNGISRKNLGKQVLISNFVRDFYKNTKNQTLTNDDVSDFLESKTYEKKLKKYNSFYSKKEKVNNCNNIFVKFINALSMIMELDVFLNNIYETLYSKIILAIDQIGVHYEIKKISSK